VKTPLASMEAAIFSPSGCVKTEIGSDVSMSS